MIFMVSKRQLKEAEKVQVIECNVWLERDKIIIPMIYIDKYGRHERTVTWHRYRKPLMNSLDCYCLFCSNYGVNSRKLCIYKLRAIRWLIKHNYWDKYFWELITNPMRQVNV